MKLTADQHARYTRILKERERHTDQTVDEFCSEQGITPWIYYYWKRRLRQAPASNVASLPENKFLPVRILPSTATAGNGDTVLKYEMEFPNGITVCLSGPLQREDHSTIISAVGGLRP